MYDPDIHEIQEHGLDISSRTIYLATEKDTENSINFQSMYRFIKNLKFLDSINHATHLPNGESPIGQTCHNSYQVQVRFRICRSCSRKNFSAKPFHTFAS